MLHQYEVIAERMSPDGGAFDWTDQEQKTQLAKAALKDPEFKEFFEEFATESIYRLLLKPCPVEWFFRRSIPEHEAELEEVRYDACLMIALNHLCGVRVYDKMVQVFRLERLLGRYDRGFSLTRAMCRFAEKRGFKFPEGALLLPYVRDGVLFALGIKKSYTFSPEQLAVLHWDMDGLNFMLSVACDNSHVLLRLDRTPYSGDLTYNSHMVACRWNPVHLCWEARESVGPWFLFKARMGSHTTNTAWNLFKGCRQVSIYELCPAELD